MSCCLKTSILSLRTFCRYAARRKICTSASLLNLTVPQPDGQPKVYSPKLEQLAASITELNLLEVAELSDLLKTKLNLPDAPVMSFGSLASAAAAPAAEPQEDEAEPAMVQTSFSVKMLKYEESQKIALIKEVKNLIEGMNLVKAKKFIENLPALVTTNVGKDEAEKLKEAFTKVGAEVEIV